MLDLYLSPIAEQDLAKIYEYTFNQLGADQADKYQDELFHGMGHILDNPDKGKPYPHFEKPYRKLHINRHLLFYKIDGNQCIIMRILHDRMDTRANL